MLPIDFHPSGSPEFLQREMINALRANRFDPKGLYVTPHQAELWRQVSLRHSPVHTRPGFGRIYEDAFARIAPRWQSMPEIELIGLGCGTGQKEEQLYQHLKAGGHEIHFTAIDVSESLVRESGERLVAAGAGHRRSLVCDLGQAEFLAAWVEKQVGSASRMITFFGLVPNFAPSRLGPILRSLLRPQDILLVSVHLAPDRDGARLAAMKAILPQYDNPETLAWLAAALETWSLSGFVHAPEIVIGEVEDVPVFLGQAQWKTTLPFEKWGETFSPRPGKPFRLFQSLRYTPRSFQKWLETENFESEQLIVSPCGEEGIWSLQLRAE